MTKFKLNSDSNNSSQVTLTSYMIGASNGGEINHGYESTNDLTKEQNICIGCQKKSEYILSFDIKIHFHTAKFV